MRILYINHYAGSPQHGMEYRPHYLARHWVTRGHNVTIIAASASHVRHTSPELSSEMKEEMINGIRYIWLKTPPYQRNGLRRAINMASFVRQLYRVRGKLVEQIAPDVVIASSTYTWDIYPARSIALRAAAKLIYEVHDLWPLTPIELGRMPSWHPFVLTLQWGEDYACRHADLVVSMLPFADRHLSAHGMDPDKFHYIPNGIDIDEWDKPCTPLPAAHQAMLDSWRHDGRFIVCYAGAHGPANALSHLITAAGLMGETKLVIALLGGGPEKAHLCEFVVQRGIHNVYFLDPLPKEAIPAFLRQCDATYIGLQKQPLFRFGVSPNKLMDYMAAGKPIINAIDAPNEWMAAANCGISVIPEDVGALTSAIASMMAMTPAQRIEMGRRAMEYVRRHHDYGVLAEKFLSLLHKNGGRYARITTQR